MTDFLITFYSFAALVKSDRCFKPIVIFVPITLWLHSSTDRILDSGSRDMGSNPTEVTKEVSNDRFFYALIFVEWLMHNVLMFFAIIA